VKPERVYAVDRDLLGCKHVGGPVVAVGGLEGDLDLAAVGGDGPDELERVVVDPHVGEHPAVIVHRGDHRAPAVQVDSDVATW
jgi:hypothetical protein